MSIRDAHAPKIGCRHSSLFALIWRKEKTRILVSCRTANQLSKNTEKKHRNGRCERYIHFRLFQTHIILMHFNLCLLYGVKTRKSRCPYQKSYVASVHFQTLYVTHFPLFGAYYCDCCTFHYFIAITFWPMGVFLLACVKWREIRCGRCRWIPTKQHSDCTNCNGWKLVPVSFHTNKSYARAIHSSQQYNKTLNFFPFPLSGVAAWRTFTLDYFLAATAAFSAHLNE